MKKIVVVAFCFSIVITASAQNLWSVFGGPQSTSARYKVSDKSQDTENKWGFQLGSSLKIPFENQIYFAPHVYYSLKGYVVELKDPANPPGQDAVKNDVSVHTIELAPLLQIDFSKKPSHMFVRFGPSIDIAFKGKEIIDLNNGSRVERDMVFSFSNYGRFTSSAIAHLGYETPKGFYLFGHFAYGLGSMNNADGGPTIRHNIFGISIGKYFGHNPNIIDTRVIDK
jgi:hypothetical protein